MDGIRVNERDLQTVQAATGLLVDQLRTLPGQVRERGTHVVDPVRHVVHAGPALREKAADGRVLPERAQELDAAVADLDRDRLGALRGQRLAMLELGVEETGVGVEGLLEVANRDAEVVYPTGPHGFDASGA